VNHKDVRRPIDRVLDKLGQQVVVGDTILYAVREGDTAGMSIGKVVKIEGVTRSYSTEEITQVHVRGINEWNYGDKKPALNKRNGILTELDRIAKWTGPVPAAWAELLRDA